VFYLSGFCIELIVLIVVEEVILIVDLDVLFKLIVLVLLTWLS